jgi:ABC-type xylose transport system substrate-binding protein
MTECIGKDGNLTAIIRILDGTQTMAIYESLGSQARLTAEVALEIERPSKLLPQYRMAA